LNAESPTSAHCNQHNGKCQRNDTNSCSQFPVVFDNSFIDVIKVHNAPSMIQTGANAVGISDCAKLIVHTKVVEKSSARHAFVACDSGIISG